MAVEKIIPKDKESHKMDDNEWIQANLKLICKNNSDKIMFVNRRGSRANKKDRNELNILMSNNNLANIGDMKSFLLQTGKTVCEKFDGNWLDYLEHKKKTERKEKIIESIDNQNKGISLVKNYWWLVLAILIVAGYLLGRPLF